MSGVSVYQVKVGPKKELASAGPMGLIPVLQVQGPNDPQLYNWYSPIEGFDWQEGHQYVIEIEESDAPVVYMDASSKVYKLVKVISDEVV